MTRARSTPEGIPTELNAEYYAQRASHALVITEGTQPSADHPDPQSARHRHPHPRQGRRRRPGRHHFIAVGALALANPDLPERIRTGAPLNTPDPDTFYGGDATGYTDYPTLATSDRA